MKKTSAVFLQGAVVLLGILVFAALLWEPTVEGVNASATTLSQIYLDDPFLAYIYLSFIAVFVGMYQMFKLLGCIGNNETYSQKSVQALRTLRYCAFTFAGLIFGATVWIKIIGSRTSDDIAGGMAIGMFLTIVSILIAVAALKFEKKFGLAR